MSKGKGWLKIAELEWKDQKFPIRVDTEHGTFTVEVPTKDPLKPKHFHGPNLVELKNEVTTHLTDQNILTWEPMIHIHNNRHGAGDQEIELRRFFRAIRGDRSVVWRNDAASYDDDPKMGPDALDSDREPRYGTLLPYSKETWKALRRYEAEFFRFNEIVSSGVTQANVKAFVEIVAAGGLAGLIGNPKKWRINERGY